MERRYKNLKLECKIMDKRNGLRLTMLGTGNALATKCYNTCFSLESGEEIFLVDAGGGNEIIRILQEEGISFAAIHDFFITHAHSDHILGAVWVIRVIGQMIGRNQYEGELRIYAHARLIEDLQMICRVVLMKKVTDLFGSRIRFVEISDGMECTIINKKLQFFNIQSTKLLQYGFEIEEYGLVFCGDEPLKEDLQPRAKQARYLLHEAFCLYEEREIFRPYEKHHSTVRDVCRLAESLQVENLILMHTEDSHMANRKGLYTEEGSKEYHGKLMIPDDREKIWITDEK